MKNELLPIQPARQGAADFSTSNQSCLTRLELAELLRVSVRTVDRMIAAGELPVRRVRGGVRFLRSDVEQYLKGESLKPETRISQIVTNYKPSNNERPRLAKK